MKLDQPTQSNPFGLVQEHRIVFAFFTILIVIRVGLSFVTFVVHNNYKIFYAEADIETAYFASLPWKD